MTTFQAGQRVTAGQLNDGVTPVMVTSGASAATGFTLLSFSGYTIGGHLASFFLFVTTTNLLTATTSNLTDIVCATIPANYRPLDQINVVIGNGSIVGEATVDPSTGQVTLRAASDSIAAGTNIRMNGFFVSAL